MEMFFLRAAIFGFVVCVVDAINIDVTSNGNRVQTILPGSDVILNCSGTEGDAVDRVDWLKGNQSVTDNVLTKSFHGRVSWSRLLLQNVSPANTSGVYTCRTWKNNSMIATLQRRVCVDEMKLQVDPMFIFMKAGSSIEITCTAVQAVCEKPKLQWLDLSGKIVIDNIESMSGTKLMLTLNDLKTTDTGSYKCRAMDSAGREVKSETSTILVEEREIPSSPLIISSYKQVVGYHGDNMTLSFNTRRTPRILSHPTWVFGGRVLHDSTKYSLYKSFTPGTDEGFFSLTVYNLTEDDSGNYTLRVTTDTKPPAVGHVKLRFLKQVDTGTTPMVANVTCEMKYPVSEKGPPKLYWSLNGTQLTTQSRYKTESWKQHQGHYTLITMSLTIYNYSESDCGWYTCGVNTSHGAKEKKVAPCKMTIKTDSKGEPSIEPAHTWLSILLAISFISTTGVTIGCVLLRKYKKKTMLYTMSKGFVINKEMFLWDLFISYSSKDFEWVSNQLLPLLDKRQISYSVHSKDFEVGKTIVDNMADSVYKCKQVVAVLSENYMKSKFCRTELDMAICRHVSVADSCLTVIKVDEGPVKKLSKQRGKKVHVEYVQSIENKWDKTLIDHLMPLIRKSNNPNVNKA